VKSGHQFANKPTFSLLEGFAMEFCMPTESVSSGTFWSAERLDEFCKRCSGAPPDWPHRSAAVWALLDCLGAAAVEFPELQLWTQAELRPHIAEASQQVVSIERNLLRGRSKSYSMYLLLIELRKPHRLANLHTRSMVRRLLGYWSLIQYLEDWTPKNSSIASIKKIVSSSGESADVVGKLERFLSKGHRRLIQAIESNPIQSSDIGLSNAHFKNEPVTTADTLWGNFNTGLRKHWATHIRDASSNKVRAIPGKDALSVNALRHAGKELKERVRAGDIESIATCLQVVTLLPERLLKLLPLDSSDKSPRFLAHLDLSNGRYVFDLSMAVDISEIPPEFCAHLCVTTGRGFVYLPKFLLLSIRQIAENKKGAQCLGDIIQFSLPNPRSTLVQSFGHRITLSRIQSALPALLIHKGAHRWPVAIATQSWWLVSKGRRAYSVCPQSRVNELTAQTFEHLGWGKIDGGKCDDQFVGSALAPSPESLKKIAEFLRSACVPIDKVCTIEQLNKWAAYCSFLSAWFLALRARERYPVNWMALVHERQIGVNDKDVHLDAQEPVPVIKQLREVMVAWNAVVAAFYANFEQEKAALCKLRVEIESIGLNAEFPLFSIDGIATIRLVGTDTWLRHLPVTLRVVRNFGRHYWPWRLMERGIVQRQVDLLMRHKTTYLSPYGAKRVAAFEIDAECLRHAMESEIADLLGKHFLIADCEDGENA
jgi:hypothetical protein